VIFIQGREKLRRHFNQNHVNEGALFKCKICDYSNYRQYNLRRHTQSKQSTTVNRIVECSETDCLFESASSSQLKTHIESKHEGLIRYKCDYMNCSYGTNRRDNLKTHNMVHTGEKVLHAHNVHTNLGEENN